MAVLKTSEDILVLQSRAFSDEEFAAHCRETMTNIASGKRGPECCVVLRDLYRYLACRIKRRSISDELMKQMKGMIIETGKCPKKLRLLAMLILRDLSPTVGYSIKMSSISADVNWLPLVFPLIFAQGEELGHIALHVPQFVRWVKSSAGSNSLQRNSLLCVHHIHCYYGIHLLTEDQVSNINSQLAQWLSNASILSASNPHQRKLFSASKSKGQTPFETIAATTFKSLKVNNMRDELSKFQPVSELDGAACHSFFTVLNIAQYCFPDQLLNIYAFSILRQWIQNTWSLQEGLGEIPMEIPQNKTQKDVASLDSFSFSEPSFLEDRMLRTPGAEDMYEEISDKHTSSSPSNSPSFSDITQAFASSDTRVSTPLYIEAQQDQDSGSVGGTSNLSNMRQVFGSESSFFSEGGQDGNLTRKAMSYCYRLLRQSEYASSSSQDVMVKKACIIETVSMLDFFCSQEKALVPKTIQAVRRIYNIVKVWSAPSMDVLLPILLFFVNHGEAVILDPEPYLKFFFGKVLVNSFSSPVVAFETVTFCCENSEKLRQSTTIFSEFFPNLFKILAWFPRTFLKEFLELLPAMICEKTFLEVFHFLLDLPCLAAALETIKQAGKQGNIAAESVASLRKSIAAYHDPLYKPIFAFILRQEGGIADTIDKLDVLHSVFEDCADNPRVLVCSQVAWLMLKIYFQTVLGNESAAIARKLLPVILERVTAIIKIESYKKSIQNLLADEILLIFKQHAFLVVDYSLEISEFLHGMKSLEIGFENFFINLIWIIGEYVSSKYDKRCGNQLIIQYHEAIESVTYEQVLTMNTENKREICSPRLISVLMSTLAKLASRCQDLIPKVILCINKVSKLRSECCLDLADKEALLVRATELINLLKLPNIAPLVLSPDPSQETERRHHDRHASLSFFLETAKDMMFSK